MDIHSAQEQKERSGSMNSRKGGLVMGDVRKHIAIHDCIILGIHIGGDNIWFDHAAVLFAECMNSIDAKEQQQAFDWAITALENPDNKLIYTQEELKKMLLSWGYWDGESMHYKLKALEIEKERIKQELHNCFDLSYNTIADDLELAQLMEDKYSKQITK